MKERVYQCLICRDPLYMVELAQEHGVCSGACLKQLIERGKECICHIERKRRKAGK